MKNFFRFLTITTLLATGVAHADNSASPATQSDTDAGMLNFTPDEIDVRNAQLKLRVSGYKDSGATKNGTSVQIGFHNPTYLVGEKDEHGSGGILAPVISGAEARFDISPDKKLENYDGRIAISGIRAHGKLFSDGTSMSERTNVSYEPKENCDEYSYYGRVDCEARNSLVESENVKKKEKALEILKKRKAELDSKGYDTTYLDIAEKDGEYYVSGKVTRSNPKPFATGELVFLKTDLVAQKRGKMGFSEHGLSSQLFDINGHVAFKVSGLPLDLCGQATILRGVLGSSQINDEKALFEAHWLEGSACAGSHFTIPVLGTYHVRNEAAVEWAQIVKDGPNSDYARFSDTTTLERNIGNRKVGLYYDYSVENSDNPAGADKTNKTHMFGLTIK